MYMYLRMHKYMLVRYTCYNGFYEKYLNVTLRNVGPYNDLI